MPKLTDEEKLSAARVLDTLYSIGAARGNDNEIFAQEILMDLVVRGIIDCFWAIPKNSELDHCGIDIVCKTSGGYYFLDVKSSWGGVSAFLEQQTKSLSRGIQIWKSYPWLVVYHAGKDEAERRLFEIFGDVPSCDVLPQEVAEYIACLTPNSVSANDVSVPANGGVGTREKKVLGEIVKKKVHRQVPDPLAIQWSMAPAPKKKKRVKNRKKEQNFQETGVPLSTFLSYDNILWRSRFETIERRGVCVVKKWDITKEKGKRHWEWVARIEVETDYGVSIQKEARDRVKDWAERKAAAMVADEIRRINRYKLVMVKL